MPQYIIRLDDAGVAYYLVWSTVVDAPITMGGTREQLKRYYRNEYGRNGMRDWKERMRRVDAKGVSSHHHESVDELIAFNRAGENESCLSKEQIIDHYIRGNPRAVGTQDLGDDETTSGEATP